MTNAPDDETRMPKQGEIWPPPPNSSLGKEGVLKTCPECGRKLLTKASLLCNWCGSKIDDAEYLERAAQARHERDLAEKQQVEAMIQEEAKFGGVLGRMRRRAKLNPKSGNELSAD